MAIMILLLFILAAVLIFVIWVETKQMERNERALKEYTEKAELFVSGFESLRAIIDANAAIQTNAQMVTQEMRVELELLRAAVEAQGNALHLYSPVLAHLVDLPPLPRTTNI